MTTIVATSLAGDGAVAAVQSTLNGAADTFTYKPTARQVLVLRNPTGAPISPVLDGADGTTVSRPGLGPVSVAAGYAVGAIAAGAAAVIPLDTINAFLQGVIAVNAGSGLVAVLTEYA